MSAGPRARPPARLAVLASGSGTNLQALLDADLGPAEIAVVLSDVAGCEALARAERAGVATEFVDPAELTPRRVFDAEVARRLEDHGVQWVLLAGFMRILTGAFLDRFPDRVVNVHPGLLPAFPGLDAQGQAFRAAVKIAGCTVHLVDAGVDTGPILAQAAIAVSPSDTEASLRARILEQEHLLFPAVVRALVEGGLERQGRRVHLRGVAPSAQALRAGAP